MRFVWADWLRAAYIFNIVGFWHLFNYTDAFPAYYKVVTVRLTVVVLGLFVMLSGYLLGGSRPNLSIAGTWTFYKRRLLRIYPLYVVALWSAVMSS